MQYRGRPIPRRAERTVEGYRSEKATGPDGTWRQTRIVLEPVNRDFALILVVRTPQGEGDVQVVAEWLGTLGRI